jgi:hypothetical protein
MTRKTDEHQKEIYKQAVKELINDYVQKWGWFSITTMALLLVSALIYFILNHIGWVHVGSIQMMHERHNG